MQPDFQTITKQVLSLAEAKRAGGLRSWASYHVVLPLIGLSVVFYGASVFGGATEPYLKVLAVVGAAAAFGLSFVQWQLGRDESTYDSLYDRLKISNDNLDRYWTDVHANDPAELINHRRNMYVFSEVDNLEYVLGKKRLQYAETVIVRRAVQQFWGLCTSKDKYECLMFWLGADETTRRVMGYEAGTCAAARYIARQANAVAQ